jgi:hypothetical protein
VKTDRLAADNLKLDGGGSLNGSVTTGSKAVSVRTSTGALLVFDRSAVKQVVHGRSSVTKTVANSANPNAKSRAKRRKLTSEEESWIPKVRALVSRLAGEDRARSRQARAALLNIDATDAIPAISTYLGSSSNEQARHLYLVILHNMRGPKPVYYLVALSLYDPSPAIRSEARKAIREEQLDSARHLYIAALRFGSPRLARIAAIGLGEIGDPRGDSVPDLINALVSYGTVARLNDRAESGVLYTVTVYSTPGLKMKDASLVDSGQAQASAIPIAHDDAGRPDNPTSATPTDVTPPGQQSSGGLATQNTAPSSQPIHAAVRRNSATSASPATVSDVYEEPIVGKTSCKQDRPLSGEIDHPEVLDALLKITDQPHPGYGFNRDRWRTWWANEKANRDLQRPAVPDRAVSSTSAPH